MAEEMTITQRIQSSLRDLSQVAERRGGRAVIEVVDGVYRADFAPAESSTASVIYSEWSDEGCFVCIGDDGRFELIDHPASKSVEIARSICEAVICAGYERRVWLKSGKRIATEIVIDSSTGRWTSKKLLFSARWRKPIDEVVSPF